MPQISRRMEMIHPTIGGMSTGLTNTHIARGFSDLYHVFARKQCILCPVLRHVCITLLHRFEIFSSPGTIAHCSIRLPPRNLASSRGCSLATKYFYYKICIHNICIQHICVRGFLYNIQNICIHNISLHNLCVQNICIDNICRRNACIRNICIKNICVHDFVYKIFVYIVFVSRVYRGLQRLQL